MRVADDAARGDVQPGRAPPNLDFLPVGQPEAPLPQGVIQDDADVFDLRIEVGARGEVERHPHQVRRLEVEEQRADNGRGGEIPGSHLERGDAHRALRKLDRGGVAEGDVVHHRTVGTERVGDVAHFVAFAQPDRAAEVVLDDAEVIAMVIDVGGQLGAIAPSDDALLAELRRLPVHFQLQLVRFHESRRLGEPFAELAEEEEKPVSLGFVVAQGGVDGGTRTPLDRATRQRQGGITVPVLGRQTSGYSEQQDEHDRPAHRAKSR